MTAKTKIVLIYIFLPFLLQASTFNIKQIQENFYNKVVLEPLYFKTYKTTLDDTCKNNRCYSFELSMLVNNPSVEKSIKQRYNKFSLDEKYWNQAEKYLWTKRKKFTHSQFVTLVDLSKQVLIIALWDNDKNTFYKIGYDFISSGNIDKELEVTTGKDHFLKTPTGFFSIKSGWRADGKIFDDNVTMPYGNKDTFVFYFGTQKSVRYNTFDANGTKIKDPSKWPLITDELEFAMHAHKSTAPFGQAHSHGCIRMTNELNLFLDNNLVFFKHLFNEKKEWTHPYKKGPIEPENHELAGEYMLIIDKL